MEQMTIKQVGAAGVEMAIANGMKAAEYARELEAMTEQRDMLERKCAALMDDIAAKEQEITALRRQCRGYRASRRTAYAQALKAQAVSVAEGAQRRLAGITMAMLGALAISIVYFAIVWCVGV